MPRQLKIKHESRKTFRESALVRLSCKISWCSGYHICLTHRRSAVRARPRSCFLFAQLLARSFLLILRRTLKLERAITSWSGCENMLVYTNFLGNVRSKQRDNSENPAKFSLIQKQQCSFEPVWTPRQLTISDESRKTSRESALVCL